MKIIVLLVMLLAVTPVAAQTPQPLPLPTLEMYEQLATANANIADLPADLTQPDGLPMLSDESGAQMFGYVKWLVAPAVTDEWAGPFAPIFNHIGIGLASVFVLVGIYSTVYVTVNIGSWVSWLVEQARRLIDLLLQATQAAPFIIILAILLFIGGILYSQPAIKEWVDAQLDRVLDMTIDLANTIISRLMGGI